MKVGLVVPQFGVNSTKENLITFIHLAEREGFESLWVYDRMLYAINPQQATVVLQIKKNGLNILRMF
jgi:hypothetical protein